MDEERLLHQARRLCETGHLGEAEGLYRQILSASPGSVVALVDYGVVLQGMRRLEEALASFDRALAIKPDFSAALNNRGNALRARGRIPEALESFNKVLAVTPEHVLALNNRGNTLRDLGRFEEALASFEKALAIKPDFAVASNNRGNALKDLKRFDEALSSYDKALAINSAYAEAFYNRGGVLREMNRFDDALYSYDKALAINPGYADAFHNRGGVLRDLKRFEDALSSFDKALALKPDDAEAWHGRGITLRDLGRFDEALASFDNTIKINPEHADAFDLRGHCLWELSRPEDSLESFEKALSIKPDHRYAFGGLATSALHLCDWERTKQLSSEIEINVKKGNVVPPLTLLGYCDGAALQSQNSSNYISDRIAVRPPALWNGAHYRHDRIRLAYLSSDFRRHPVAFQMADLFELHDRSRFEVFGISLDRDDGSEIRAFIAQTLDQFHEVQSWSYHDVAQLLRRLEVDIAIDLNGHTRNSYPEILSYRPAPVQVNYLGYPGTMGADFIDYVIADRVALPRDQQPYFTERIVHLPNSFFPANLRRPTSTRIPSRREMGLPEKSFVFCCFNNNWKITAPLFDVWTRLLKTIPDSILWLKEDRSSSRDNLRKVLSAYGVDPARLVFAGTLDNDADHLARYRLADLFLDTLPYNAHATACDALWAGLPVLTCYGKSLAGRVAASLLNAAGLPELVTQTLSEYEALALKLAHDPELLQSFRRRLQENRSTCPLFDTDGFRRSIEAAYVRMWEIAERGDRPLGFGLDSIG